MPISSRNTAMAMRLVVLDFVLFAVGLGLTIASRNIAVQVIAAVLTGFVIARLFILGHDACHQSLTVHRRLNRWLGRLLFLPLLTPYRPWKGDITWSLTVTPICAVLTSSGSR